MDFIWLLFAHFIGDMALQSDWIAQNKGKHWYIMFSHCMIWTGCISVALQLLGIFYFGKVIVLLVGHWICDYVKCSLPAEKRMGNALYYDQAFHMLQLLVVFLI